MLKYRLLAGVPSRNSMRAFGVCRSCWRCFAAAFVLCAIYRANGMHANIPPHVVYIRHTQTTSMRMCSHSAAISGWKREWALVPCVVSNQCTDTECAVRSVYFNYVKQMNVCEVLRSRIGLTVVHGNWLMNEWTLIDWSIGRFILISCFCWRYNINKCSPCVPIERQFPSNAFAM